MVESVGICANSILKEYSMLKNFITVFTIFTMILLGAPACAEQDKGDDKSVVTEQTNDTEAATATQDTAAPGGETAAEQLSVMDMPVNFSTPEDVEISIEKVRQEAGEAEALRLTNALGYILTYDLSLGRDKDKLYKKLDGRTPNAIIAKMKR
jgi:hypothetical protein